MKTVRAESSIRSRPWAAIVALTASASLALGAFAGSAAGSVRTTSTEYGKAERVKLLPITKQPWQETRSVMSLGSERVGELLAGDRIEAAGDFEVTTCLKPDPRHPGGGQPCIGDMYGYNPTIRAQLVLAPSASATGSSETKAISKTKTLTCRQDHPVRNHHCVVSIPWSGLKIDDPSSLPCPSGACSVNMLVTAFNPAAGSGEKVVVGSSDDNKRIHQGLAQLSSVRYRGKGKPSKVWRGGRARKTMPVVPDGSKPKRTVIYSAKVSRLKAGDQLVVDARAQAAINRLPYNVFQRTEVVFAKTKKSTKAFGKPLDTTARVSASSGFNCTQKKSAHARNCDIRKTGVLSVKKNVKGPFYVNLVAGQQAVGIDTQTRRWRSGHSSRVQKGGYVRVERYSGSSACKTCSTGWTSFNAVNRPTSGKPAKLVSQLAPFGITSGAYNCSGRSDGSYVCKWRSEGRFGDSPKYSCETRATMRKKAKRFKLKVCKSALGAQLWDRLLNVQNPVDPSFTGSCDEQNGGDFKCKWFGDMMHGPQAGKGCKGFGVYKLPEHRWVIDPCRP